MLGISIVHKVDIAKMLPYHITPMPLIMGHFDGAICKTQKSVSMKCIEYFFLLHTMKNVPKTFGGVSKKCLQMVTQVNAKRFDVIFDEYFTPSKKNCDRSSRHECTQLYFFISSPDQVRPADFAKELKNSRFKQALVDFFISHWATDKMISFIGNIHDNKIVSTIDEKLSCPEHEEADTKIVYHVCNIDDQANLVIKCSDTDIAVIMLCKMHD